MPSARLLQRLNLDKNGIVNLEKKERPWRPWHLPDPLLLHFFPSGFRVEEVNSSRGRFRGSQMLTATACLWYPEYSEVAWVHILVGTALVHLISANQVILLFFLPVVCSLKLLRYFAPWRFVRSHPALRLFHKVSPCYFESRLRGNFHGAFWAFTLPFIQGVVSFADRCMSQFCPCTPCAGLHHERHHPPFVQRNLLSGISWQYTKHAACLARQWTVNLAPSY